MALEDLKPLHNFFLFEFLNETKGGFFVQKNKGRIIIRNPTIDDQGKWARWARVLAVGPEITEFVVGDIVILEPGKWTLGHTWKEQKFWQSDDRSVIGVGPAEIADDFADFRFE